MNLAEGSSYAEVFKDVKGKVQLDTVSLKIRGIRRTRNGNVFTEVGSDAEGRAKMSSAIMEDVGNGEDVRELIPRIEVKVLDLAETKMQ